MIYYVTGGERSGKSDYAQKLALQLSDTPYYLATSRIWDDNHQERIDRHIADRDERWISIEEEKELSKVIHDASVVVIDCVTLWLTNFFVERIVTSATCYFCLHSTDSHLSLSSTFTYMPDLLSYSGVQPTV